MLKYDIAGAKIDLANREGALAGTFMGHLLILYLETLDRR